MCIYIFWRNKSCARFSRRLLCALNYYARFPWPSFCCFQASQAWTAWFLLQQYKSSFRLVTEIRNDLPRIVEIQFCLTKFLCKMVNWIERLVLWLLTSCLTRTTLCCEWIRSIFWIVIILFCWLLKFLFQPVQLSPEFLPIH